MHMKRLAMVALAAAWTAWHARAQDLITPEIPLNELLLVVGAEGAEEYGETFATNAALWQEAASQGNVKQTIIDADGSQALERIETFFEDASKDQAVPLWIVFIGHGTYDRREALFNLAGPDLKASVLHEWLKPFQRPLIILNTSSSSGAFLPVLSGPNRIIVTATKSGTEVNFASFGGYLASGLLDAEADLNNDGENSVFELFQYAASQTADYYEREGRIQTETPLLDDNGDGRGTSLKAFAALAEGGTSSREPDGDFSKRWALILSPEEQAIPPEMRQKRNVLESQIDALKRQKASLEEDTYYEELEALALQVANLYADHEATLAEPDPEPIDEETEEVGVPSTSVTPDFEDADVTEDES